MFQIAIYDNGKMHFPEEDFYQNPQSRAKWVLSEILYPNGGITNGDIILKRYHEAPRRDFLERGAEIMRINNALIRGFNEVVSYKGIEMAYDCIGMQERVRKSFNAHNLTSMILESMVNFFPLFSSVIFARDGQKVDKGVLLIPFGDVDAWHNTKAFQTITDEWHEWQ